MIRENHKSIILFFFTVFFCLAVCSAKGVEQQNKYWSDLNISGWLFQEEKIKYSLETQGRFFLTPDQFESFNIQPGLGYQATPTVGFWLSYRYSVSSPINSNIFRYESRIVQDFFWTPMELTHFQMVLRTRLEERHRLDHPQWGARYRERISFNFTKLLWGITPTMYEEIFVNLNQPPWLANQPSFAQIRSFAGLIFPVSNIASIQIGYLNQVQFRNTTQNIMSHILYTSLSIKT